MGVAAEIGRRRPVSRFLQPCCRRADGYDVRGILPNHFSVILVHGDPVALGKPAAPVGEQVAAGGQFEAVARQR